MRLRVLLPTQVLVEEAVSKVTAEAENGFFTMLPRHIDFVSALVPGVFTFVTGNGEQRFLAVDEGILVKRGDEVLVSTARAIRGENLEQLRETVESEMRSLGESEKKARSVLARLEANALRRFSQLGGR